jgi:hypothetical protein
VSTHTQDGKKIGVSPATPDVFIGSEKPDLICISNTRCPDSQAFHTGGGLLIQPLAGGAYNLCMSSDGGINWEPLRLLPRLQLRWVGGQLDPQGWFYTFATPIPDSAMGIWRYDPTTDTWSKVTKAPAEGSLQAVTPNGNVALWFMGTAQGKLLL